MRQDRKYKMSNGDKPIPWYLSAPIHGILLVGAIFFILPLFWMMSTSLKPLGQTLKVPDSVTEALVGIGHRAEINGKFYDVTLESKIVPSPENPYWIVTPLEEFPAGEMTHPFGPETWRKYPIFNQEELKRMETIIKSNMKVLADKNNPYDEDSGLLHLLSGKVVKARLIEKLSQPADGQSLWLVREWRPEDTDTKEVGSTSADPNRAWAVLKESRIQRSTRIIPQNYTVALKRVNFWRSFLNTMLICIMTVSGVVISSLIVAYGFAFIEFRGRELLFKLTLATMMIPFPIVMVPTYLLYRNLGWVGTFKPLWVWSWFGSAFFIFLLRQFLLGLPKDLLDAARIDGCSELEILWHVVVPLSKAPLAMVALFQFLGSWRDFMGPLIYLNNNSQFTLSLALQAFSSEHGGTPWHLLMAASTVFSLPLIVLFFLTVKTFIRSVTTTGLKE
ncbi:carbohydrate ABC transporter permease [Candidatus Poribacteria bacterium]|nr:carbohydrate ABC transporter permease [Candidatus Poribacteria bacterium]